MKLERTENNAATPEEGKDKEETRERSLEYCEHSFQEILREDDPEDNLNEELISTDLSIESSTISSDNLDVSIDNPNNKKFNIINFVYTNARSLAPKIESLIDVFENWNLHFAAISETWLRDGERYTKNVRKLEQKENLSVISRNRKSRGGGVAIIFNSCMIDLKYLPIKGNDFELVAAIGRTVLDSRKFLVASAYYPPQMKKEKVDKMNECITELIESHKRLHEDIQVFICGDINKKDITSVLVDHPDIAIIDTQTTRGSEILDLCLTSMRQFCQTKKLPPLETQNGTRSDHDTIFVQVRSERKHLFTKTKFTCRPFSEERAQSFMNDLVGVDWAEIHMLDVDQSVDFMDRVLLDIYHKNFPEVTTNIKSSDPPWMNKSVRRASTRKRKYYRKRGKNDTWKRICEETESTVKEAKVGFINKVKKTVTSAKNTRAFFKALPHLTSKSSPKPWNISMLFPHLSNPQIADKCVEFFSAISREFEPLDEPRPVGDSDWVIELHEISSRLKYCKKPKSTVDGDIRPELVTKCHDLLAIPLYHIYNSVLRTCKWPDKWKLETVKIIPKVAIPQSLKDVRNISCTPLFSKVLEQIVLKKLRENMSLSRAQFGGIPGIGIDHFLAETWHEVLMNLEEPGTASSLVSIDFSKAFNRMDHSTCIRALENKQVPQNVLGVVRAFLFNRKMAVHVNGSVSKVMNAPGGAPQGSVMGSYLFCAATESFLNADGGDLLHDFGNNGLDVSMRTEEGNEHPNRNQDPISPIAPPHEWLERPPWDELDLSSSEESSDSIHLGPRRPGQRLLDTTIGSDRPSQSALESFLQLDEWTRTPPTVKAYIDDFNVVEKIRTTAAICHVTTNRTAYEVHSPESEKLFHDVKREAEDIGMIVNDSKTQLLCIHPSGKHMNSYIRAGGETLKSRDTLKILGFTFGQTPDASANTAMIVRKFIPHLWSLWYLKKAGMSQNDMLFTYKSVIRPVLDFAATAYHTLLTQEQSMAIERLQLRAMKAIFGANVSYRTVVESGKIDLLYDRREKSLRNFAIKASKLERCTDWFPLNHDIDHNLRRREKYFIPQLRTDRAMKSPIIRMRQILNELQS